MKHIIRRNGQLEELDFELSSGLLDCNRREIFEGDTVKIFFGEGDFVTGTVVCTAGAFLVDSFLLFDQNYLDMEVVDKEIQS